MIQKIRVINTHLDLKGKSVFHEAEKITNGELADVKSARVYRLEGVSEAQARKIAEKLFCEPINQRYTLNQNILKKEIATPPSADCNDVVVVEIAYKPGVMNPEVASIIKSAKDLGINLKAADSSTEYGFFGEIKKKEAEDLVKRLKLFNGIVEHIVDVERDTLLIKGKAGLTQIIPLRKLNDEELLNLSQDKLFLNLEEMKVIQESFTKIKRDPTDVELETLAQTWSEHCAHKTFKAKLIIDGKEKKPLITRIREEAFKHNKNIVSAFVDNSGVMDFYDGWALCGKAETHNAPSAIEPYGGAMTGSGGVFRDIVATGLGAKCIASTDIFCLAPWALDQKKLPEGCLPPDYILRRVVEAVKDYGNRIGIPTNNGSFHFHDDFRAKPTVLVGSYGLLPKQGAQKGRPKIGDLAISLGGRTGRDGIHGATFSSGEMTNRTISVNSSAVQIGNAIEEKRTFDAIIEASQQGLLRATQDCGAGGFSSAIGELGEETGIKVHLENAPLKYQGLSPWEIWVSESQERMILVVTKKNLPKLLKICQKYNVEASVLGEFDGSKKLQVFFGKEKVANLDMKFVHHGLPQRKMVAVIPAQAGIQKTEKAWIAARKSSGLSPVRDDISWSKILKKVLSNPNICSKEPIVRLYDHSVQGTNITQQFSGEKLDGPNDAAIIRPLLSKKYGMVLSHGLNPVLNNLDPYWGSIWASTEAISNYVAVGGDYKNSTLINNYVWPFPDSDSLWSLDRCVDSVIDFMKALKLPVISGKDSLSSTYRGADGKVLKIPPVLCMSVFGKIPDVTKTVTSDFKQKNSVICLVGKMDWENMGGSIFLDSENGINIPKVDLKQLPKTLSEIYKAIKTKKVLSCHDVSEGGVITSIFEMCVGGDCGAMIDLTKIKTRSEFALFNETAGCFIVEVESIKVAKSLFKKTPLLILGKTSKDKNLEVIQKEKRLFKISLDELKNVWQKPMKDFFS